MPKKYRVTLAAEEREELERLLSRGKADVRCLKHVQILLRADEAASGPGWSDGLRASSRQGVACHPLRRRTGGHG